MTRDTTPDELRELLEKATKGPWEHMKGRGLVRAIRGDLAVPLFEPLEPYADPRLEDAPTVRVGKEVIFRARSQGARQSAALKAQHYNAALIVAAVNSLPALLDAQAEAERLRGALREIASEDFKGPPGISVYAAAANELTRHVEIARSALSPTQSQEDKL